MTPLMARNFGLAACQGSVYTPDDDVDIARLLRELVPSWLERFNTEPQLVSHPTGGQPRVLLRSATGMWRCELAADRADFYWLRPEVRAPAPTVDDFFKVATNLLASYAESARARIGRLAALVHRITPSSTPALTAIEHFVRPELATSELDGSESFELHTHKRRSLDSFVVNAWVRCRATADGAITVEQDLNTVPEHAASRRFTLDDIASFFRLAAREHERVFTSLFPGP